MHTTSKQTEENANVRDYSQKYECDLVDVQASSRYLSTLCDVFPLLQRQICGGVDRFLLTRVFYSRAVFAQTQ